MQKVIAFTLLFVGVSGLALAIPGTPEIDPGTGATALALLSGAILMIRRKRKK